MARYQRKPIILEAEQYKGQVIDGVCTKFCLGSNDNPDNQPHIHTLEGVLFINMNDWIITGVNKEKYPCKPEIFEKIYEKVQ